MRDRFGATNPRALACASTRRRAAGGSPRSSWRTTSACAMQALSAVCGGHSRCTRTRSTKPWRYRRSAQRRSPSARRSSCGGRDHRHGRIRWEARTSSRRSPTTSSTSRGRSWRHRRLGGAAAAIEQGFVQGEIEAFAFSHSSARSVGRAGWWSANALMEGRRDGIELLLHVTPRSSGSSASGPPRRAERDGAAGAAASTRCGASPRPTRTPPGAPRGLEQRSTIGEIAAQLREPWGTMAPSMRSRRTWIVLGLALIPAVAILPAAVEMSGRPASLVTSPTIADKCGVSLSRVGSRLPARDVKADLGDAGRDGARCRRGHATRPPGTASPRYEGHGHGRYRTATDTIVAWATRASSRRPWRQPRSRRGQRCAPREAAGRWMQAAAGPRHRWAYRRLLLLPPRPQAVTPRIGDIRTHRPGQPKVVHHGDPLPSRSDRGRVRERAGPRRPGPGWSRFGEPALPAGDGAGIADSLNNAN